MTDSTPTLPSPADAQARTPAPFIAPSQPHPAHQTISPIILADGRAIRGIVSMLLSKAGLSQVEASVRLGMSKQAINNVVRGRTKSPTLAWLAKLAQICGARLVLEFPDGR